VLPLCSGHQRPAIAHGTYQIKFLFQELAEPGRHKRVVIGQKYSRSFGLCHFYSDHGHKKKSGNLISTIVRAGTDCSE
jgi:hypothetical protein